MSVPIHAITSLKAALRAHLLADPDLVGLLEAAVFDAVPRGTKPPYLLLGDAIARENGTPEAESVVVELDLVAVTVERGSTAALALAAAVEKAVRAPLATLVDHHLVAIEIRQTATRHDAAASLTRASLRLRAFLEAL